MENKVSKKRSLQLSKFKEYLERILKVIDLVESGVPMQEACVKNGIGFTKMRRFLSKEFISSLDKEEPEHNHHGINVFKSACTPYERLWLYLTGYKDILYAPKDLDDTMKFVIENSLSPVQRKVFTKVAIEEVTYQDIGEELGISKERVRQIYNKARNNLLSCEYFSFLEKGYTVFELERLESLKERKDAFNRQYQREINDMMRRQDFLRNFKEFCATQEGSDSIKYDFLPLSDMNLPTRAQNALLKEGYRTVGSVARLSRKDLKSIRNMGVGCVDTVVNKMRELYNINIV